MRDADSGDASWPELVRATKTIVVVDVVESVRLMQANEADVIERWRRYVHEVRQQVLPAHQGRLVKSLGDGMLLEFNAVRSALAAVFDLHRRVAAHNQGRDPANALLLRMGVHRAEVVVDELDIYGAGVNLAARLAGLAGPGEVVVSAEVRDEAVHGIDGQLEDLGDCYLKHLDQPVRAHRLSPPDPWTSPLAGALPVATSNESAVFALRAGMAVMPLQVLAATPGLQYVGDALADQLIAALSRNSALQVTSRLSSGACAGRDLSAGAIGRLLGVPYVVTGSCTVQGERARLQLELTDSRNEKLVWSEARTLSLSDALLGVDDFLSEAASQLAAALSVHELERAQHRALPSMESYALLLAAIALMHRMSPQAFERAHQMLEHLVDRHPRLAAPRAWLGKWHVLKLAQGWSTDAVEEGRRARSVVARALDAEPEHSLALAIDGLACAYALKDLDAAKRSYALALQANPSESLAWLFSSALHSYRADEGHLAAGAADQAMRLSPLDPLRYYYCTFAATAHLSAGHYLRAVDLSRDSIRANRTHSPAYRNLAISLVLLGQVDEARAAVSELLQLEPALTVSGFMIRYPGRDAPHAMWYAQALAEAGLPD